jgi:hypothetical protein
MRLALAAPYLHSGTSPPSFLTHLFVAFVLAPFLSASAVWLLLSVIGLIIGRRDAGYRVCLLLLFACTASSVGDGVLTDMASTAGRR